LARAYAATLGNAAFAVWMLRGLARGDLVYDTVSSGLLVLIVFTMIGWIVGEIFDRLIRQSVELRFREAVDNFGQELAKRVAQVEDAAKSQTVP
jgi:hypothetical protein